MSKKRKPRVLSNPNHSPGSRRAEIEDILTYYHTLDADSKVFMDNYIKEFINANAKEETNVLIKIDSPLWKEATDSNNARHRDMMRRIEIAESKANKRGSSRLSQIEDLDPSTKLTTSMQLVESIDNTHGLYDMYDSLKTSHLNPAEMLERAEAEEIKSRDYVANKKGKRKTK